MVLNPYDQSVYDAGYKYIPQSQYLLNPFKIPGDGSVENDTFRQPTGIASLGGGGGGGGFNPYNTDMSQIRTDFRPDYEFRRFQDYNPELSDLQNQKIMQNMENFKGYDYYNAPQSKIGGLMNFIPYAGALKRGAEFIGGALKGILPENQRAIMENQARGAGIFTDDIGRIVTDDYNTAGGIMAGYNLNKIDKGTFDKRRGRIEKTLGDKYGLSGAQIKAAMADPNYTGPGASLVERLGLLDEAEEDILGLQKKTKDILTYRQKKKDAEAAAKAAKEEAERQEAERVAAFNKARADRAAARKSGLEEAIYTGKDTSGFDRPSSGAYAEGAGMGVGGGYASDYQGGGGSYSAPSSSVGYSAADNARESARGRYFMNGGLVDLVDIYD